MINDVKKFVAERLRDDDLFSKVLEIMQYVMDESQDGYNDIILKYKDPAQLNQEATEALLSEFGYDYIADIFQLFEEQDIVNLVKYLNFISLMKGHRDGLEVIFEFLGLDYEITEWWESVNNVDVSYGDIGLPSFGYTTKRYYNVDTDHSLVTSDGQPMVSNTTFTLTFWYRFNIADNANQDDFIVSDGNNSWIKIAADGELFISGTSAEYGLGNSGSIDLQDGQWHNIILRVDNGYASKTYIDGQLFNLPSQIYQPYPLKFVMSYSGNAGEGAIGELALLNIYAHPFNQTEVTEYYNNGEPLNPFNHSKGSSILINFTFGDNVFDNTEYNGATAFFDSVSNKKLILTDDLGDPVINTLKSAPILANDIEFLVPHEWKMTVNLISSLYAVDLANSAESLYQFTRNYVYPVLRWLDIVYEDEYGAYKFITHNISDKQIIFEFNDLLKTITSKAAVDKMLYSELEQDALEFPDLFDNNLHQQTDYAFYTEDGGFYLKLEDS